MGPACLICLNDGNLVILHSMVFFEKIGRLVGRLPHFVPSLIILAVILCLTLLPVPDKVVDVPLFPGADKVVHFLMFGTLAVILWWDESRRRFLAKAPLSLLIPAALISTVAGGVVEVLQDLMHAGRSGDWMDLLADMAGAVLLPLILRPLVNVILRRGAKISLRTLRHAKECPGRIKKLYESSFPPEERREWTDLINKGVSAASPLEFICIYIHERPVGMITCWHFDGFDYVEHFAVDGCLRGQGIGARVLGMITDAAPGLVLEVEPAATGEMARRRIAFYKRCGFRACEEYAYVQPPYSEGLPSVELMLMTCGQVPDLDRVASTLHKEVYNVKE